MTAFLDIVIAPVHAAPRSMRAVHHCAGELRPLGPAPRPITPDGTRIRRWRTAAPALEFPPD
jgi:hypothetical protein